MDAELYTLWDAVQFYLLYFRHLIFGLVFILDIHLFTKWKATPKARPFAILLAAALIGALVWWYAPVLF